MSEQYLIQDTTLSNLGDKIRTLNGTEDTMTPVEMGDGLDDANNEVGVQSDLIDQLMEALEGKALEEGGNVVSGTIEITENGTHNVSSYAIAEVNVSSGELTLQNKTITPSTAVQTISADNGYDGLDTVTVSAMPTVAQATPSVSIDGSGLITATATQSAGYVEEGTKSATQQLTTKGAATIVPGTSNQTIAAGTYLTGTQTIQGDTNLKAENIKQGVSIFGVAGSLTPGSQVVTGTVTTSSMQTTLTINFGFSVKYMMLAVPMYTSNMSGSMYTGTFFYDKDTYENGYLSGFSISTTDTSLTITLGFNSSGYQTYFYGGSGRYLATT